MKIIIMIQILKDYYWAFRSIFHQRSEIREYLDRYVPDHADMFTPLRQFKNKHIGQRCFIVATGPSLTIEDVSKLKNEICWSMNSGFKLINSADFHPAYYAIADGTVYQRVKEELVGHKMPPIFYNEKDIKWDIDGYVTFPLPVSVSLLLTEWQRNHLPKCLLKKRISNDVEKCIYMGDTVVNVIIQLCFYMGFKEIYLIGTDCNYFGNNKHSAVASYKNDDKLHDSPDAIYNGMISDYQCAKIEADRLGVKIYNATRGGMLEVFERVDLDEILGLK